MTFADEIGNCPQKVMQFMRISRYSADVKVYFRVQAMDIPGFSL